VPNNYIYYTGKNVKYFLNIAMFNNMKQGYIRNVGCVKEEMSHCGGTVGHPGGQQHEHSDTRLYSTSLTCTNMGIIGFVIY